MKYYDKNGNIHTSLMKAYFKSMTESEYKFKNTPVVKIPDFKINKYSYFSFYDIWIASGIYNGKPAVAVSSDIRDWDVLVLNYCKISGLVSNVDKESKDEKKDNAVEVYVMDPGDRDVKLLVDRSNNRFKMINKNGDVIFEGNLDSRLSYDSSDDILKTKLSSNEIGTNPSVTDIINENSNITKTLIDLDGDGKIDIVLDSIDKSAAAIDKLLNN